MTESMAKVASKARQRPQRPYFMVENRLTLLEIKSMKSIGPKSKASSALKTRMTKAEVRINL